MSSLLPVELAPHEEALCRRLKTHGRLYAFLRRQQHLIFDDAFGQQLAALRSDRPRGQLPVPPARLVLAVLLQAYAKVSDDEAVRRSHMDKAWQLVLGTLGEETPAFSKATLVHFRAEMIEHGLDKVLIARSVAVARQQPGFDAKKLGKLRIAIDSAGLEGAGRVEDTLNLLGHALRILVGVIAVLLMTTPDRLRSLVGLSLLGASSLKAGLDLDWSDPEAREQGLQRVLEEATRLENWVREQDKPWISQDAAVVRAQAQFQHLEAQNVEVGPDGTKRVAQGVAKDRQISLSDPEMRHGHKSKSVLIDGYKRYVAVDLDDELALEGVVLPANRPEHEGADKMAPTILTYGSVEELAIDRAFLPSKLAADVAVQPEGRVICRPYQSAVSSGFGKTDFAIDLGQQTVTCPAGQIVPLRTPRTAFSARICSSCPLRPECLPEGSLRGRVVPIHPQEKSMQALRELPKTAQGRAKLRERTKVEHGLAHLANRQGPRARYCGERKNDFDVRRTVAVNNLFRAERAWQRAAAA
jgi:hypothetical protein